MSVAVQFRDRRTSVRQEFKSGTHESRKQREGRARRVFLADDSNPELMKVSRRASLPRKHHSGQSLKTLINLGLSAILST